MKTSHKPRTNADKRTKGKENDQTTTRWEGFLSGNTGKGTPWAENPEADESCADDCQPKAFNAMYELLGTEANKDYRTGSEDGSKLQKTYFASDGGEAGNNTSRAAEATAEGSPAPASLSLPASRLSKSWRFFEM